MRMDNARSQGNLLLEKRDGHPPVNEPVDPEARKQRHTYLGKMDAIACGVEAWVEENTGYSRRVTETTVDIARALSVPDGEIKQWESARSSCNTKKGRVVKSLLERLQGDCRWR